MKSKRKNRRGWNSISLRFHKHKDWWNTKKKRSGNGLRIIENEGKRDHGNSLWAPSRKNKNSAQRLILFPNPSVGLQISYFFLKKRSTDETKLCRRNLVWAAVVISWWAFLFFKKRNCWNLEDYERKDQRNVMKKSSPRFL